MADVHTTNVRVRYDKGHIYFCAPDGFGEDYQLIMDRWSDAIQACLDWRDRLAAVVPKP